MKLASLKSVTNKKTKQKTPSEEIIFDNNYHKNNIDFSF